MNANKPNAKCPEEKLENKMVEQPSGEVQLPPDMARYHAALRKEIAKHGGSAEQTKKESDEEYYWGSDREDDPEDYDDDKSTFGYSDSDEDDDSTED